VASGFVKPDGTISPSYGGPVAAAPNGFPGEYLVEFFGTFTPPSCPVASFTPGTPGTTVSISATFCGTGVDSFIVVTENNMTNQPELAAFAYQLVAQ